MRDFQTMLETDIEGLKQCLDSMTRVLGSHMDLVNTCMVEFIVSDMFSLVPDKTRAELLSLSDDQLTSLPSLLFQECSDSADWFMDTCPELWSVLASLRENRMESLGIVSDYKIDSAEGLQHWDKIMAEKKTHEVERMSALVHHLVKQHDISCLVDLGSGKAYLSQVINSLYHIPVLAIDGKETNTQGARRREEKLQTKWGGLATRAAERAAGEAPSNRRSRLKRGEINKLKGRGWNSATCTGVTALKCRRKKMF